MDMTEIKTIEATPDRLAGERYGVQIYDDYFSPDLWARLVDYFKKASWRYGWPSTLEVSEFTHWHIDFLNLNGGNQDNGEHILRSRPEFAVIAEVWNVLKSSFMKDHLLVRCYANAHTHGVEGYPHADTKVDGHYTALVYVVPEWKTEWAGETMFFDDTGDACEASLPRPNRLAIFDGQQLHSARAVSRICPGLRMTLMFKTRLPVQDETAAFER